MATSHRDDAAREACMAEIERIRLEGLALINARIAESMAAIAANPMRSRDWLRYSLGCVGVALRRIFRPTPHERAATWRWRQVRSGLKCAALGLLVALKLRRSYGLDRAQLYPTSRLTAILEGRRRA